MQLSEKTTEIIYINWFVIKGLIEVSIEKKLITETIFHNSFWEVY